MITEPVIRDITRTLVGSPSMDFYAPREITQRIIEKKFTLTNQRGKESPRTVYDVIDGTVHHICHSLGSVEDTVNRLVKKKLLEDKQ